MHVRHVERAPFRKDPVHDRPFDIERVAPERPLSKDHIGIARFRIASTPVVVQAVDLLRHPGDIRVRQARGVLDHGLQRRLEIEDGPAERLEDVAYRRLAFEGSARFVEESNILDRNGCLVRKRLDELNIALVERPDVVSGQHNASDDDAFPQHWHSENGTRFGQADDERLPEDRVGFRVCDLNGRSALEDRAHHATLGPERSPVAAEMACCAVSRERLADICREAAAIRDRLEPLALDTREPTNIGTGEADRILKHDVEDGPEIERGAADRLEHVRDRGLLLECFLGLVEETHVLDGDDRLGGEGLEKLDLLQGERLDLHPADGDTTDRDAVTKQRHREGCPVAPAALEIDADRIVGGIELRSGIANVNRPSVDDAAANQGLAAERQRLAGVEPGNRSVVRPLHQDCTVDAIHVGVARAANPGGVFGDRVEYRLNVCR